VSSLFIVFFAFVQGYGFIKQSQKIWDKDKRSAESLSAPFFFLFFSILLPLQFMAGKKRV